MISHQALCGRTADIPTPVFCEERFRTAAASSASSSTSQTLPSSSSSSKSSTSSSSNQTCPRFLVAVSIVQKIIYFPDQAIRSASCIIFYTKSSLLSNILFISPYWCVCVAGTPRPLVGWAMHTSSAQLLRWPYSPLFVRHVLYPPLFSPFHRRVCELSTQKKRK